MATATYGMRRGGPRAAAPVAAGTLKVQLDAYRWCLFLLTFVAIGRVHQHFRFIAVFRPALLLVGIALAYAFINRRSIAVENLSRTWPAKLIMALGIFACVSAPFGLSLGGSAMYIIENYSKVLLFGLLLIVAMRTTKDLYAFVWAYVLSSAVLVWLSLFVFGLKSTGGGIARLSNLYTFDANDIGCVLMVGLALTLLLFQATSGRLKLVSGVIILGIGATIARSGSRGAFVGLVVVVLALVLTLRNIAVAKRLGFVAVLGVGLLLAAPAGYWEQMGTVASPTEDYNWSSRDGRRQIAIRGVDYMLSYPLFGLGIDNFGRAECAWKSRDTDLGDGYRCTAPHNSFVQAGSELGIPGLAMWTGLIIGCIVSCTRLRRRLPRAWLKGDQEQRFLYLTSMYLPIAMLGFAVTSVFVSFAWLDVIYYVAALVAGLHVAVRKRLHDDRTRGGVPVHRPATVRGERGGFSVPALAPARRSHFPR